MAADRMIDGYAHIGLPRFQSAEAALANMDANGIEAGMFASFEADPDLAELHRAMTLAPHRVRSFGLALGNDQATVAAGMHAQFDAGFVGFRLALERIEEAPFVLDVIGEHAGIVMAVGGDALAVSASRLLHFLERHPEGLVLSPHMAGPTSPGILDANPDVRALFAHPNFFVVLTRQVRFPEALVEEWVQALIEVVGWDRLMWGSETPVLFWRDDSIAGAAAWFDKFLNPAATHAFRGGTARRAVFARAARPVAPLRLPYDPFGLALKRPAPMWPLGFTADTRIPARLVAAWQAAGSAEPLSAFASRLLLEALDAREGT